MHHDWKIKSRSLSCSETARKFVEAEPFYTAIFEDPAGDGYLRNDYSEEAWNRLADTLNPFSFWRSTFEAPPPPEDREVVKKENAESLLRRLIEEDSAGTENARYILAIMLERRKILHQVEAKPVEGGRLLIYERHKTGEAFIIKDPQLKLEEIESLQEEVTALLGGKAPRQKEVAAPIEAAGATEAP